MRAHLARFDPVLVQAVIAGALSFSHLHDLAEAAGQGGWKAWAYPVSVDLLLVAAWRRMREQQRAGQPAGGPRLWFLIALAASLGANVATAGLLDLEHVPAPLRVVVAGPPSPVSAARSSLTLPVQRRFVRTRSRSRLPRNRPLPWRLTTSRGRSVRLLNSRR
ncbi:DUF2637 domain-containing protein [Streptomyces griseus]|uniref:DUF2637 domain-containing protein n=1 Tax=Streptomyces griseus TaxID=1911 RepID=UPI0033F5B407